MGVFFYNFSHNMTKQGQQNKTSLSFILNYLHRISDLISLSHFQRTFWRWERLSPLCRKWFIIGPNQQVCFIFGVEFVRIICRYFRMNTTKFFKPLVIHILSHEYAVSSAHFLSSEIMFNHSHLYVKNVIKKWVNFADLFNYSKIHT